MSTRASASIIIPLPLDSVWRVLRNFTFPLTLIPNIESCEMEVGCASPQTLGAMRTIKWSDGKRKHRLIAHSDIDHTMSWELVESSPPAETMAHISTLKCRRVTETNSTFVEWSAEFSSGTSYEFIQYEQKAYHSNLNDIRTNLTHRSPPTLYHIHEGPSTRVAVVAAFLGIPLKIKLVTPEVNNTEFSADKGGVVTRFTDGNLVLLESGSIVMYLIEKYDNDKILEPFAKGSPQRARYLQWFFYTSSTIDHLLFEAYTQLFVLSEEKRDNDKIQSLKNTWDLQVVHELEAAVSNSKFICGDIFTGADIMSGWSIHFAKTLGWLENSKILLDYLARLRGVAAFQKAFDNYNAPPFYVLP